MRHTLTAVFEQRSAAQHVLDELLASGYSPDDTALSSATGTGTGRDHVLTLTTGSDPDTERAVGIIERFGPTGIEDRPGEPDQGMAGGVETGNPRMRPAYPPGTEPGALQYRPREDSPYFGTQNADAAPTGNTFQSTMGSIAQWNNPEDEVAEEADYQSHHASNYAGSGIAYDELAAAYRHGSDAASDSQHRGRDWKDVEPALKDDWESRHAGSPASAWDRVKAAVRYGWDRLTS